jgi:uncharacterized protein with PQ loop repeat
VINAIFVQLELLGAALGMRLECLSTKNTFVLNAEQKSLATLISIAQSFEIFQSKNSTKTSFESFTFLRPNFVKIISVVLFVSAAQISFAQNNSRALPTGGNVVAGNATITQSNLQVNINQTIKTIS